MTTRREFMVGAAGLTFTVLMDGCAALRTEERGGAALAPAPADGSVKVNAWASLSTDGTIYIANPAVEMGQGSQTAIPLIIAEEMDADWSRVRIVPAAPDDKVYGNPGFRGLMYTAGSATVTGYWDVARTFGAQVRRVMMENAARLWNVPLAELSTEPSTVVHAKSGRRLGYGEIAAVAQLPAAAPVIKPEELKQPGQYRLIGKDVMRVELPSKVDGSAQYSIDVQLPGMLYGAVLRGPVEGSAPLAIDDSRSRDLLGGGARPDPFRQALGQRRRRAGSDAEGGEDLRSRIPLRLHVSRADGAAQLGGLSFGGGRCLRDLVRHAIADHGGRRGGESARHSAREGEAQPDAARRRLRPARAPRRRVRRRFRAAVEGSEAPGESAVDARGRRQERPLPPALGALPSRGAGWRRAHRSVAAPRRLRRDHRVPGPGALQGRRRARLPGDGRIGAAHLRHSEPALGAASAADRDPHLVAARHRLRAEQVRDRGLPRRDRGEARPRCGGPQVAAAEEHAARPGGGARGGGDVRLPPGAARPRPRLLLHRLLGNDGGRGGGSLGGQKEREDHRA